jgi:hypothetical protein
VSKGVAGNQRKRVFLRRRQQRYILRIDHANHSYSVVSCPYLTDVRVEPFDPNRVARNNCLQRPEPACAMTCQHEVTWFSRVRSTKEARRPECQGARSCALQDNLVIVQAWDSQPRNRMRVGPGPGCVRRWIKTPAISAFACKYRARPLRQAPAIRTSAASTRSAFTTVPPSSAELVRT